MAGTVGTPTLVTRAAYAEHRGVSRAAVTQWAAAGRIVIAEDGRVDLGASDRRLDQSGGSPRGGKRKRGELTPQDRPAEVIGPAGYGVPTQADFGTLLDVRKRKETIRANREEVDYRERIGELVECARYDKAVRDGMAPILSALDSLPARLGPLIIGEIDGRKVQRLIEEEVGAIRKDAAATLRRLISKPDAVRQ